MPVVPPSPMTVATNLPAAAPPNKWPTKSMEISAMTPSKTLEKMVANPKYSHFWNSGAVLLNRRHKIKMGAKPTIYKRPSEFQTAFVSIDYRCTTISIIGAISLSREAGHCWRKRRRALMVSCAYLW